jgi:hypothetical protein
VRARAGAEVTAVTVACGGSGSRTTALRDLGSSGGASRKKGRARALARVRARAGVRRGGAAPGAEARLGGAVSGAGERGAAEEGETDRWGPPVGGAGGRKRGCGRCWAERSERERERGWRARAWDSEKLGRAWPTRGKGERGIGLPGRERAGPRGGGEGEQAGLLLDWILLSLFLSLFYFFS